VGMGDGLGDGLGDGYWWALVTGLFAFLCFLRELFEGLSLPGETLKDVMRRFWGFAVLGFAFVS